MKQQQKTEKIGYFQKKAVEKTLTILNDLTKKMQEEQQTEKQKINRERLILAITTLMNDIEIINTKTEEPIKKETLPTLTIKELINITKQGIKGYAQMIGLTDTKIEEILGKEYVGE